MKKTALTLFVFALIILAIPAAIVLPFKHQTEKLHLPIIGQSVGKSSAKPADQAAPITVAVYRAASGATEQVDLNRYLIGVVGSEMPAKFPIEALKAQALAARTYILAQLMNNPNARVSDTVENQVYHSLPELKKIWGKDYDWRIKKITQAVEATNNKVITYQGSLISPVFFSTSNGRTEDASNYWSHAVPYLRSVASPWDKASPKYKNTKKMSADAVAAALGISLSAADGAIGKVVQWTATGHVARFAIGGKTFTGREIREKLTLSSTDFTLTRQGDTIIAQSIGSGHDVGMSQYGAAGMAQAGKNADQIVTHYYSGTKVTTLTLRAQTALARK